MNKKIYIYIVTFLCILFSSSFARQPEAYSTVQEMHDTLDVIGHTFHVCYGPAPWKNEAFNWHLDQQLNDTKKAISQNPTLKNFQKHLSNLFINMRDLHTGIVFSSTQSASLPFMLCSAGDRFFVHRFFDRLASTSQTLKPGDEILAINGVPIKQAFQQFLGQVAPKDPSPTDISIALRYFTRRSGALLHPMPTNLACTIIKVREVDSPIPREIAFQWRYHPEKLPFTKSLQLVTQKPKLETNEFVQALTGYDFDEQSKLNDQDLIHLLEKLNIKTDRELVKHLRLNPKTVDDETKNEILDIIKFIKQQEGTVFPPLGKVLWQSEPQNYFEAAIYELDTKQKVGFVRLHTFHPSRTTNIFWKILKKKKLAKKPWDEFADIINHFQENTDILVIDQTENAGGADLYAYALASMLTETPLNVPPQHMTITSEMVCDATTVVEAAENMEALFEDQPIVTNGTILGYPLDDLHKNRMVSHCKEIIENWKRGITYTAPIYVHGVDTILPSTKARYLKPIIVLVNELSISCGDVFPALLQDNKRALIFGHRTGGAGGAVKTTSFPNRMGIDTYRYTDSLIIRSNGLPIENLGVTPDVEYELTAKDLSHQYQKYTESLMDQIRNLAPATQVNFPKKQPDSF